MFEVLPFVLVLKLNKNKFLYNSLNNFDYFIPRKTEYRNVVYIPKDTDITVLCFKKALLFTARF